MLSALPCRQGRGRDSEGASRREERGEGKRVMTCGDHRALPTERERVAVTTCCPRCSKGVDKGMRTTCTRYNTRNDRNLVRVRVQVGILGGIPASFPRLMERCCVAASTPAA